MIAVVHFGHLAAHAAHVSTQFGNLPVQVTEALIDPIQPLLAAALRLDPAPGDGRPVPVPVPGDARTYPQIG